jgi:hypothetical protein
MNFGTGVNANRLNMLSAYYFQNKFLRVHPVSVRPYKHKKNVITLFALKYTLLPSDAFFPLIPQYLIPI